MYPKPQVKVERFRIRDGRMGSDRSYGNNGVFQLPYSRSITLLCVVSDGKGWEHVSVRADDDGRSRIPTWEEMCFVKDAFWPPEEEVVQYHPRRSEYVDMHPHVLHLWRPTDEPLPRPPASMVGVNLRPGDRVVWVQGGYS